MASLNMSGPFSFTESGVDSAIHDNKIGNYALGTKNSHNSLSISYVGRSDSDLNAELKQRLQTHPHSHFKASYANSIEKAYKKECQNYHDFSPPQNEIHPAKPNSNISCPICGQ